MGIMMKQTKTVYLNKSRFWKHIQYVVDKYTFMKCAKTGVYDKCKLLWAYAFGLFVGVPTTAFLLASVILIVICPVVFFGVVLFTENNFFLVDGMPPASATYTMLGMAFYFVGIAAVTLHYIEIILKWLCKKIRKSWTKNFTIRFSCNKVRFK